MHVDMCADISVVVEFTCAFTRTCMGRLEPSGTASRSGKRACHTLSCNTVKLTISLANANILVLTVAPLPTTSRIKKMTIEHVYHRKVRNAHHLGRSAPALPQLTILAHPDWTLLARNVVLLVPSLVQTAVLVVLSSCGHLL